MKRKTINQNTKINGFYPSELIRGFLGEQDEGKQMLKIMGLPIDIPPFSVANLLQNRKIFWKDSEGNRAYISFKLKPDQIECHGSYRGNKKIIRVFREWGAYENMETILRLESEAIGELCMRCVYEPLVSQ